MKPFHYVAAASAIASVALFMMNAAETAGIALVLGTVVEILGSMITGKQGNDTEG